MCQVRPKLVIVFFRSVGLALNNSESGFMSGRTGNPERPATIGLIGLGLIGSAVAERLLAAGHTVIGFDVSEESRLKLSQLGGVRTATAGEVAEESDIVWLALPNDTISRDVLREIDDQLRPGQIIADLGTGDPRTAESLAVELNDRGVQFLDATISGSSAQVRRFESFAWQVRHVGPSGRGAWMKLVTNLVLGLNRAALAEGLAFAEAVGLDPETALAVLRDSMAYSRIMDTKGPKMVARDFTPEAPLSQHLKDVRLIREAASRVGQALPLSTEHQRLLEVAESLGLGSLDNSAILESLRQRSEPT
ncbi:MAG: 6-phosphogluconate dehydrogenase [Planctomycetota bacterium]|nr:MAG: 6-phosphogluconate dehydrogenase [Planctomycetota bacterium]